MKRKNRTQNKMNGNTTLYITGGILIAAVAAFLIAFILYSNHIDGELYSLDSEYLSKYSYIPDDRNEDTASASSSIGKTVEESQKDIANNAITNSMNSTKKNTKNTIAEKNTTNTSTTPNSKKVEKDPTFQSPLEGEITKEFAKDSLIYSETLKEWITHLGVDIMAEKATVVKAAADGTVKAIKNDPRFGLTIIMEHANGYETRYANLLTTEFVTEGEEVKAGQTIGTVGDTSVYEIVDEPHLHFEILKNSENVNPADYVKF